MAEFVCVRPAAPRRLPPEPEWYIISSIPKVEAAHPLPPAERAAKTGGAVESGRAMLQDPNLHYLDNAATTLVAPEVADAIHTAMLTHWANPSSLYAPGVESEQALRAARAAVAKTLGCKTGEVYFTAGGSEGNNMAVLGAARSKKFGKRIVVSGFEHPSVYKPAQRLREEGCDVVFVPPHSDGTMDVDELLARVDKNTILAACMLVNNETGARCEVERLAAGVKAANARCAVHVDAVQAWMRVPIRLDNIDTLAVSGHKIHAPKGVGALYVSERYFQTFSPPYVGGEQEREKRPGTENLPYAVGLAAAARRLAKNMPARTEHIRRLNRQLRQGLAAFPEVTVNSPDSAVPEVLNFSENVINSQTMLNFLSARGVYISTGSACDKGAKSHTLQAMGLDDRRVNTAIRVSFCAENTAEDVDAFLNALADGMKILQRI